MMMNLSDGITDRCRGYYIYWGEKINNLFIFLSMIWGKIKAGGN
jgi:hypothetical protein